MSKWIVVRTWEDVEARTAAEAVELTQAWPNDKTVARRVPPAHQPGAENLESLVRLLTEQATSSERESGALGGRGGDTALRRRAAGDEQGPHSQHGHRQLR